MLGVALGAVVASDPPRSFGERIGPLRPGPGRLVGIPYAPEGAPLRETQRLALVDEIHRLSAHGADDLDHRTPESLRERAILALVQHDADGAVQLLERALERLPDESPAQQEAILRSDLSAAHLQRFAQGDSPVSSLAALDQTARIAAGGFSGVRFNHAVALDRLYLGRQSRAVWEEIAAASSEPKWASEAERRLRSGNSAQVRIQAGIDELLRRIANGDPDAAKELVQQDPQRARELATRNALWDWADAAVQGDLGKAARQLAEAELLSAPLAEHGDREALDSVAALRSASPEQLQIAARGLRSFHQGFQLYRAFDHEKGIAMLEAARRDLAALKLPQELEAALYQAFLEHDAGRPGAKERVASVAARAAGKGYPGIEALVHWFEALIAGRDGRPYDQAEAYRRTRAIYERLGEVENQSSVEGLLGESLVKLGRRDDALEGYLAAVSIAPRVRDPYRRRLTWSLLAFYARRVGFLGAGLAFQAEMLEAAAEQDDPTAISEPLLLGASLRASLGDVEGAKTNLATARILADKESDPEDRDRTLADLARVEEEVPGGGALPDRLAALNRAVALYAKVHQGISEMTVRASRARLRATAGDLRGTEEDLGAIVAFAKHGGQEWLSSASDETRYTFGREAKSAFAAMVRFQAIEAREPWRAFTYQETARELLAPNYPRHLGLLARSSPFNVPDPATIQTALPSDVALLEFGLMDDRIVSWLVMPEGVATFERRVDKEQVDRNS